MLVTTKGQNVVSSATLDVSGLQPCSHEEADSLLPCLQQWHEEDHCECY